MIPPQASQYMYESEEEEGEQPRGFRLARRGTVWLAGTQRTCMQRFRSNVRWVYRKMGLSHFTYVGMLVLYTIIGGFAFYSVEYSYASQKAREKYLNYLVDRDSSVRRLLYISRNCSSKTISDDVCKKVVINVLTDYERTLGVPQISENTMWDFWYAVYFACTLYTTIGYGDITCASFAGRLLTVIYALIGIPILLTTLNDLGKTMYTCLLKLVHYGRVAIQVCKRKSGIKFKDIKVDSEAVKIQMEEQKLNQDEQNQEEQSESRHDSGSQEIPIDQSIISKEQLIQTQKSESELPVSVALGVTIGWIFGCAALFCLWEKKWKYFDSIYFFFISLTTIGLGDVVPEHPKYMIIAYGLVIMGLSLVSMSISVIQRNIEALYYRLLQMILEEYQSNISSGKTPLNATLGMMRKWNSSPKAKFLIPLLSKSTKQTIAQKFNDEKAAEGVAVPPVLKQFNAQSGLPKILDIAASHAEEEFVPSRPGRKAVLNEVVNEAFESAESAEHARRVQFPAMESEFKIEETALKKASIATPIFFGTTTQTDIQLYEDKFEQTTMAQLADAFAQTQMLEPKGICIEETSQTVDVEISNEETQTAVFPLHNEEAQTSMVPTMESSIQTNLVSFQDQELQTYLYTTAEQEMQCDTRNTKNQRIQTTAHEMADHEQQTDPSAKPLAGPEPHGFAAYARRRLRKALGKRRNVRSTSSLKLPKSSINKRPYRLPSIVAPCADTLSLPESEKSPSPEGAPTACSWADIEARLTDDDDALRRNSTLSIRRLSLNRPRLTVSDEESPGSLNFRRSSTPDLEWNPVDGMHAEKQLRVKTLKALFEKRKAVEGEQNQRQASESDDGKR